MSKPKYWDVWRSVKNSAKDVSYQQLISDFEDSPLSKLQFVGLDAAYRAVDLATWRLILDYNQIDKEKYRSDIADCDNFALGLSAEVSKRWKVTAGVVIDGSARHAYNCIVTTDEGILVVEPQTDRIFLSESPYAAESGFTIFA